MYGELAWWGVLGFDRKKDKGSVLLLSGMQENLKIYLKITKTRTVSTHTDAFEKNFSGTVYYMEEEEFPAGKKISDLEKKLKEWTGDTSSDSFRRLSEEIGNSMEGEDAVKFFQNISRNGVVSMDVRDPWAYFRFYWPSGKKAEKPLKLDIWFFSDEENLYSDDMDSEGEEGSFEIESA